VAPSATALSTQQLAEYLAAVSAAPDELSAIRVATERAARALEAEVAVLLGRDGVRSSVGFAFGQVPLDTLAEVIAGRRLIEVPGAGRCHATAVPLTGGLAGHLLVARSGEDGFGIEEVSLLRAMVRVIELTVARLRTSAAERHQAGENARLLASLQERHRLLEQLSRIQRAITRRAPLQSILDTITSGAQQLLGDDVAALRMVDPDDPRMMLLVSQTGLPDALAKQIWRVPPEEAGATGQAALRDELVVMADYAGSPDGVPELAAASIRTAMAAPVHENSTVVGALAVASYRTDRVFGKPDRDVLQVFAEQVSLAVTDAKTQEAMRLAFHDSLTGLASRALFLDRLDHALARAARQRTRLAVLFVDLDRFKNINDSLGHSAGDELLVGVADRLRSCLGPADTAARLGGDEFAVVLPEVADQAQATDTACRIIERLRSPFLIHGHESFIDASVGIAFNPLPPIGDIDAAALPSDGLPSAAGAAEQDAAELMRSADLAMYQAKKNGKGRYEIFRPALRTLFLRNLEVEGKLRRSVERGDFVLHYQPIVDLSTLAGSIHPAGGATPAGSAQSGGGPVMVEALVRWRDGGAELVPPREFIPLAEETGLILPIDRWVLREACRQAGVWNRRPGGPPVTVSVNLSARLLQQADLPQLVAGTLAATGLDPDKLIIEITESLVLPDTVPTVDQLRELKALGVRVAIDDFGTGYSSLAYLRQFPVDIVKIDKSFVDGAVPGSQAAALARAIVQLGQILQLTTVAEGVETAEQLGELRAAGCDLAQGFYFAEPLPADEVERLWPAADPGPGEPLAGDPVPGEPLAGDPVPGWDSAKSRARWMLDEAPARPEPATRLPTAG
jgi:diguanylate cyclase (GGDEF)-like protein